MVCTLTWKQNVGHLGNKIVVCVAHGHRKTMKMVFSVEVTRTWWDNLYEMMVALKINVIAGDVKMSLTQVVPQFTKRGL